MMMRTTLTLDADVAAKLKSEMRRSGASFKELVNKCLRRALNEPKMEQKQEPFRVRARDLGFRSELDYIHTSDLLEKLEDPWHK